MFYILYRFHIEMSYNGRGSSPASEGGGTTLFRGRPHGVALPGMRHFYVEWVLSSLCKVNVFFILVVLLVLNLLTESSSQALEKLQVVTTFPHDAAIAVEIGGPYVQVESLTRGEEDPHLVTTRFSLIPLLNRADLLIVNGQLLEIMWLPELLQKSRNDKILPGKSGYLDVSRGADLIFYSPDEVGRSPLFDANFVYGAKTGQIANHHYWLNPANGLVIAKNIFEKLSELDPDHESAYRTNYEKFGSRLRERIQKWDAQMAPYAGLQVVSYHRSWNYLLNRHGIRIWGYIEPLELGLPKQSSLKKLARQLKTQKVRLILLETYQDKKVAWQLAEETGAHILVLPSSVSPNLGIQDYFQLFEVIYGKLLEAFKGLQG